MIRSLTIKLQSINYTGAHACSYTCCRLNVMCSVQIEFIMMKCPDKRQLLCNFFGFLFYCSNQSQISYFFTKVHFFVLFAKNYSLLIVFIDLVFSDYCITESYLYIAFEQALKNWTQLSMGEWLLTLVIFF